MQSVSDTNKGRQRILLSHHRLQMAASPANAPLGEILSRQFDLLMKRLESLEQAIETVHGIIRDLMAGANFSIGVEWSPHKTRPGLHPRLYRLSKRSIPAFWPDGNVRHRWADVVHAGYLSRYVACTEGLERHMQKALEDALTFLRKSLKEREQLLATVGGKRRQLTARLNAADSSDPKAEAALLVLRTAEHRSIVHNQLAVPLSADPQASSAQGDDHAGRSEDPVEAQTTTGCGGPV